MGIAGSLLSACPRGPGWGLGLRWKRFCRGGSDRVLFILQRCKLTMSTTTGTFSGTTDKLLSWPAASKIAVFPPQRQTGRSQPCHVCSVRTGAQPRSKGGRLGRRGRQRKIQMGGWPGGRRRKGRERCIWNREKLEGWSESFSSASSTQILL